jgi:hypothetical protein
VSIVHSKTFGAYFSGSPPFWADGTEAHKTALTCVNTVESKYQLLKKCKLLFDVVVRQQQHLHCFRQHSSSFERYFTKHNFYFETDGVFITMSPANIIRASTELVGGKLALTQG